MANIQLVTPNLNAQDATGMCLRFTQRIYQNLNPYYYQSAWEAWQKAVHKQYGPLPTDVSVPVYFEHWGTYGAPPTYANWGHVVGWVPGRGYLSSPASGYGQQWFPTIQAVERTFNAKYVGWAYDVGGLKVADIAPVIKEDPMPKVETAHRKETQKANKTWTTLRVHQKGYISLMEGGEKARRVRGIINLAVSRGALDVRAVRVVTNSDGTRVVSTHTLPFKTLQPGYNDYVFAVDLPKGKTNRLRLEVRRRGLLGQVDNVQVALDYWDH